MTKKVTTGNLLIGCIDAGNGKAKGLGNARPDVIKFEPLVAPITEKRGLEGDERVPQFTLKDGPQHLVFGLDDVTEFGKWAQRRRLNALERYTDPDYFRILNVQLLQLFAAYRGQGEYIEPVIALSLPISQYNNVEVTTAIRKQLVGKHELMGLDACQLRINIRDEKLALVPESYGALMHWAYDLKTLKARHPMAGTIVIVDIGYETTDVSVFAGGKYQRDSSFSLERAGMGIVARAIRDFIGKSIRGTDVTRIDRAMRSLAGLPPGMEKKIEVLEGVTVDVTDVYDSEISNLGVRIAQDVLTQYTDAATRIVVTGGGDCHLGAMMTNELGSLVEHSDDAEDANLLGGYIALKLKAQR